MTRPKLALAALLTAALVVASLPLAAFAQAASPRHLRITDTLFIQKFNGASINVLYDWRSRTFGDKASYATGGAAVRQAKRESFQRAMDSGQWGVVQLENSKSQTNSKYVLVFWAEHKKTLVLKNANGVFSLYSDAQDIQTALVYASTTSEDSGSTVYSYLNDRHISVNVSNYPHDTNQQSILFFTGDYTLDPSAEGLVPEIPKGLPQSGVVNAREVIAPEFSYEIKGKELSVAHLKEHDKIQVTAFSEYTKDGWSLKNSTYQVAFIVQHKKGGDVVVPQQLIDAGGRFSVILPDNGEYSVTAQYVATACYSYGPNSATPPYCINATPSDSDTLDYQSKVAYLIIDGRDKSGSTLALTCLHGFCQEEPLYEDCSVYDLKFSAWEGGPEFSLPTIDGIACSLRNSLKWFVNELILPLFVPRSDYFSSRFGELQSNIKRSFGFLALPFTFIGNIFTSVSQGASIGETCALPPLSLYGATATIHLCAWRQQLPQAWSFLQLVIQGGIALSFLWVAYSLLMRFFGVNVPGEDADEEFEEVRWHDERDGSTGDWERRRR